MSTWNETPVVFECRGERLVGIVHRTVREGSEVGVLVVVGGPQYRVGSHRQFTLMARALATCGIPVMRFDYRGMGDSEGEPRSFESVEDDILAAIEAFRSQVPELRRLVLWGLCDAASAILMCTKVPSVVVGYVLVNPWVRTPASEARAYVRHYYLRRLLQRDFWRKVFAGEWNLRQSVGQFATALTTAITRRSASANGGTFIDRMLRGLHSFRGPVLVLLSGRDLTAREFAALRGASPEWNRALASERVSWVDLEDADHTFSSRSSLEEGTQATLRWIESHFGVPA